MIFNATGSNKALDLMMYVLHTMKLSVWTGQGKALEKLLNFYAQKMEDNQVCMYHIIIILMNWL